MVRRAAAVLFVLIAFTTMPEWLGVTAQGASRDTMTQAASPVGQFKMDGRDWCTYVTVVNLDDGPGPITLTFTPVSSTDESQSVDLNLPVNHTVVITDTFPSGMGTVDLEGVNFAASGQVVTNENCLPDGDGIPLPLFADPDGFYFGDISSGSWMFFRNFRTTPVDWSIFCLDGGSQFYTPQPGQTLIGPLDDFCPPGDDNVLGMNPAMPVNIVNFVDGILHPQRQPTDRVTTYQGIGESSIATATLQVVAQNFNSAPISYDAINLPSKERGSGTVPGQGSATIQFLDGFNGTTSFEFSVPMGDAYTDVFGESGRTGRANGLLTRVPAIAESEGARKRAIGLGAVNNAQLDVLFGAIHVGSKKKAKVTATLRDAEGNKILTRKFKLKAGEGAEFEYPESATGAGLWVDFAIKRAPVWTYLVQVGSDGDFIVIPGRKIQ